MSRFHCRVTPTTDRSLAVADLVDLGPTPGDVGVAVSGGGSRSMIGGLGGLRALVHLERAGVPLLGLAKAISGVSGGAWLAAPFTFLSNVSDEAFLNRYVADPGRLVVTDSPGHAPAETLDALPPGNLGHVAASPGFGIGALILEALLLRLAGVAPERLWQTLVGQHVLRPYDLFSLGEGRRRSSLFSWNEESLERDVTGPNPALRRVRAHLAASGAKRVRRPFFVCNTSIFVRPENDPRADFEELAPVQITPILAGAFGMPQAIDANDRLVGGGGATSFSFGSRPIGVAGDRVEIEQSRPLSLADATGLSSVAYAETLENAMVELRSEPDRMGDLLRAHGTAAMALRDHEPGKAIWGDVERALGGEALGEVSILPELLGALDDVLGRVIPTVRYWPVRDLEAGAVVRPTRFADGGSLENTGVASLLAWRDVRRILALVHGPAPMAAVDVGAVIAGKEVPSTRILVDSSIPPLFGFQPWIEKRGYRPYAEGEISRTARIFRHDQVFPASTFPDLLRGLWSAAGGDPSRPEAGGADRRPALFRQELDVLDNEWFGVRGGRRVSVAFFQLQPVREWEAQLSPDVRELLETREFARFPNYPLTDTPLSARQVNLLAHLTAWSLGEAGADLVRGLFEDRPR